MAITTGGVVPQQTKQPEKKIDKTARLADLQRQIDHLVNEREKLKGDHGEA